MNPVRIVAGLLLSALLACAHAAKPGDEAPALSLTTASGQAVTMAGLRGKVVYVDFWASWCGPCRKSFPWMAEMQRKYGAEGFMVVAVNVDKKRADAERFLQAVPAPFTVVYDPEGATPTGWNVTAMPSSFVVDPMGKVAVVESGFRDENVADLERRIKALLPAR